MDRPGNIRSFIPALDWVSSYSMIKWKGDLNAGVIVGIMLIPQGMAYAVLAGLPPVYGLYASIMPILLYAIFGTSRQLAVGPVAMISLLVLAGVGDFAEVGTDRFIQLAILTAFGVGLLQLLMGVFRMGFLVNFLSHPVLSGFTSAAALIIGASQIGGLLGLDLPRSKQILEIAVGAVQHAGDIEPYTAVIGAGSILLMILLKQWKKTFPSALLVVVVGTVTTALLGLDMRGVSIVGDVPTGFPSPVLSAFRMDDLLMLIPLILVIGLVAYTESIAVAKTIAAKRGYRVDPNQELVGLGIANLGGSLFQSFPVAGGFSRTAVNDQSGARTGMASLISAAMVILTVLFLTPLFYYLPMTVLAAIIIVAVSGLFDSKTMVRLWRTDRRDLAMFLVTFFSTLAFGIIEGIAVGVVLSLTIVIYSSSRPHSAELGQLGESRNFRNVNRYPEAKVNKDVLIFRFDSPLYFANTEHFRESLKGMIDHRGEDLEVVILDASAMSYVDSTGVHLLQDLIEELRIRRIRFIIAGAIGPLRDKLKCCGVTESMGEQNFYFDVYNALAHYREESGKKTGDRDIFSPLQSNL